MSTSGFTDGFYSFLESWEHSSKTKEKWPNYVLNASCSSTSSCSIRSTCFCRLLSLEAEEPERVSARLEPSRGVRSGSALFRLPLLLPVLQTATGWPLQTPALQTSKSRRCVRFCTVSSVILRLFFTHFLLPGTLVSVCSGHCGERLETKGHSPTNTLELPVN